MGQLRNALRAYAMDGHTPPEAVERLNRLVRKFENPDMATLVYLAFDLRDRKAECVRAGHPPPLLRRPDGSVSELGVQGSPPIGVGAATYESSHWEIEPGSVVLLYTDGLVERRATGIEPGIKRLKQALSSAAGDVEAVLDHVLVELAPEGVQDDVALLAMSAESSRGGPFQLTVSADPASLVAIRRSLEAWLADQDVARPVAYEVVAACHEACANSCEHAYPPSVEGMMDIQSRIEDGRLELAVRDHGRWREPRNHDRGRGLVLMRHFMEHVDVDSGQDGTTVRMSRPVRTGEPA